tara:strand:+ start:1466 stop:1999 length:534 start_codon:yes stop_codon:yes gene_type:complete
MNCDNNGCNNNGYFNQNYNGRVDIITPDTNTLFSMQDRIPSSECTTFHDAMTGNWNNTPLSDLFFSANNIKVLQNGIRNGVYKKSNGQYKIGEQSCDELKIIMRSIFLVNAKNDCANIVEQVNVLNNYVLNYAIPQVYNEVVAYVNYRRDVSTLANPIALPVMSKSNDKQLIMKDWF